MPFQIPISPLDPIANHPGTEAGITLYVKRDDLLHPEIQGNKWRKLAPVLTAFQSSPPAGILTFGGPFSNHLAAVAAAGRIFEIPTAGIVRGQYADPGNPTLRTARENGMRLIPVSKREYDAIKQDGAAWLERDFPGYFLLPEGGSTPMAVDSCAAISREIIAQLVPPPQHPLYICVPAGTGCTAAGVVDGFEHPSGQVLVFPVVNRGFEEQTILHLLDAARPRSAAERAGLERRFRLVRDYEFGGFAKKHQAMLDFAAALHQQTGILPDPVYTAKMLFGVYDLLAKGTFPPGSTVVAVHTGGLQGWAGFGE